MLARKRKHDGSDEEEEGEGEAEIDTEEAELNKAMAPFRTLYDLKTDKVVEDGPVFQTPRGGKKPSNLAFGAIAHLCTLDTAPAVKLDATEPKAAEAKEPSVLLFSSPQWRSFERALLAEWELKQWTLGLLANVVYVVRTTPPTPPPPALCRCVP